MKLNYPEESDLNCDFIFNLANQNMSSWAVDLETAQRMAQDILLYREALKAVGYVFFSNRQESKE